MRVFTATLGTETNTFSPIPTALASFRETMLLPRGRASRSSDHVHGAALGRARARQDARLGGDRRPLRLRRARRPDRARRLRGAARRIARRSRARACRSTWCCSACTAPWSPTAMTTARAICWRACARWPAPRPSIGAELDPHCHLSQAMLDNADVIICFKEYPHTDFLERGAELADLCADAAAGKIRPVMSVFDCRMIGIYHTAARADARLCRPPERARRQGRRAVDLGRADLSLGRRRRSRHQAAGRHRQPAGRGRRRSPSGSAASSTRCAARPAPTIFSIDAALDRALAIDGWPVVIADFAGQSGRRRAGRLDLRARQRCLKRGIENVALGPLWDPQAVRFCHAAGAGRALRAAHRRQDRTDVGRAARRRRPRSASIAQRHPAVRRRRPGRSATSPRPRRRHRHRAQQHAHPGLRHRSLHRPRRRPWPTRSSSSSSRASISTPPSRRSPRPCCYIGGPGAIATDFAALPYKKARRPLWPLDPDPLGGSKS